MELHKLTNEEWKWLERLDKIVCESTPESRAESLEQMRAFVEGNGDLLRVFRKECCIWKTER